MYLHQPLGDYNGAWKELEKALEMGLVTQGTDPSVSGKRYFYAIRLGFIKYQLNIHLGFIKYPVVFRLGFIKM